MSETQALLGKIAALRQRLEQAQALAREAGSAAAALPVGADERGRTWRLERTLAAGAADNALLDSSLRQLTEQVAGGASQPPLPQQLTTRARRVLERARELLGRLRESAEEFPTGPARGVEPPDPLAVYHHDTTAMTETVLRTVGAFPDAASTQLRLCEGLEAILGVVGQRLEVLGDAVRRRRRQAVPLETLAGLLVALAEGRAAEVEPFIALANELLTDAEQGEPLRFVHAPADQPARFAAAHSLTVAQVVARVVRHDPDLRGRPMEPVLAALVHDAGMLQVPVEVLSYPEPYEDDQRRAVEQHARRSAELAARLLPSAGWLAEAAAGHHERLDGTGYPDGLREPHLAPLTRLLAVCDVYAAQCCPRPHRPAKETRTALADTLLMAEQGALDPQQAEKLLLLSFYPVGSVVELADGAVGRVVATHASRRDLSTPARPVLALLTDSQGRCLPAPHHLDLAQCEGRSIVRTLSAAERRDVLGGRYPELV